MLQNKTFCQSNKYVILLLCSLVVYFISAYVAMQRVSTTIQDYFVIDLDTMIQSHLKKIADVMPLLFVVYQLSLASLQKSRSRSNTIMQRCALLYSLKAAIQFLTLVPAVNGIDECVNRTFIASVFYGNCADMMFSGHTGLVYLLSVGYYRFCFVPIEGLLLVLSKQHYTSDIVMAVIVAQWIEYYIPFTPEYKQVRTELV